MGFVGSRSIRAPRPTPTISVGDLQQLRDQGKNIVERPDGTVLIDGFRVFRVTGQELEQVMDRDNAKPVQQSQPADQFEHIEDLSSGNELTGFDFNEQSQGVNELTDFDPGDIGQTPGGNDLIDFN